MLQTSPLLASRDFMYAHAQLDFESQLMRSSADEHANLGERIRGSSEDVAASGSDLTGREQSAGEGKSRQRGRHLPGVNGSWNGLNVDQLGIAERGASSHPSDLANLDEQDSRFGGEQNPYSYHIGVTGYYKRLGELWTQKRCRRALLSATVAMISQQMTGVNTIAFLGTTVWETSLSVNTDPKIIGLIGLVFGGTGYL